MNIHELPFQHFPHELQVVLLGEHVSAVAKKMKGSCELDTVPMS